MAKKTKQKRPRAKGQAVIYRYRTARGEKMLTVSPHLLGFPATLVDTINIGKTRLAIFSVPKNARTVKARCDPSIYDTTYGQNIRPSSKSAVIDVLDHQWLLSP